MKCGKNFEELPRKLIRNFEQIMSKFWKKEVTLLKIKFIKKIIETAIIVENHLDNIVCEKCYGTFETLIEILGRYVMNKIWKKIIKVFENFRKKLLSRP